MQEWSSLCKLKIGDAVDAREQCILAMEDGAYKISDDQYFLADAFFDEGKEKLRLLSLYWACSEPAFRRAYYRDVENDDMAVRSPPSELLPRGAGETYGEIKKALSSLGSDKFMEYASYRVMSDGAFVHKSLESSLAVYYFRLPDIVDDELPYAILWKFFSA
ncbi:MULTISPECIES: hypothetical protein [unclassified Pseudomonas]|uniref:hypothetical protein n=1 Tax=unclassified Pseudomonas TaxID=196821 RepID=UPI0008774244|nr:MULTISPECIES: hypothetical protein [unclassified Pseudomonas]SCZ33479.1 hypothetical protein SAMN03159405_03032 [Pseudomonas sp. NFACC44-2]SDA80089.1 hypothetical protein SAMN03159429_04109 [Pseudomonas sp. NFACC51]SDX99562.1 hypothetical protein SAMN03159474_04395 [Pseudomonas sp. NFACC08-1]SFH67728.1 hypothetical protein SAMN03159302_02341 [Pseudomonas sp. NFACC54]SFT17631.1 hypothetical protein SAMN03159306_04257 [Pseudomonas sp. NFACC48-1]